MELSIKSDPLGISDLHDENSVINSPSCYFETCITVFFFLKNVCNIYLYCMDTKVSGFCHCSVANIFQIIFFCLQHKIIFGWLYSSIQFAVIQIYFLLYIPCLLKYPNKYTKYSHLYAFQVYQLVKVCMETSPKMHFSDWPLHYWTNNLSNLSNVHNIISNFTSLIN